MLAVPVVLILGATVWILVTGLLARRELTAIRADLGQLRAAVTAGDRSRAEAVTGDLTRRAHRAHELTGGPAWWAAAQVPVVGAPLRTVRGVSATSDALATGVVPSLLAISSALLPVPARMEDHTLDITAVVRVTPQLNSVLARARQEQARVAALPHRTWLGVVDRGVTQLSGQLNSLIAPLGTLDQVARIAPVLLGDDTPQRYFVAFQNEAEMRGTGGLPGAFAIVVADHGRLTFTHFGSDAELLHVATGLDLGAAYDRAWHDYAPTSTYQNSNVDPDFRYAGRIWAAMWQKVSGQHVDGALALDPTTLSYLLAVTGPARLADGSQVSARTIVALTQSTVYRTFDDQTARKSYLLALAEAAEKKVLAGSPDLMGLYRAASRAASERRLLLWSADATVEAVLAGHPLGGAVLATAAPYVQPVIVNYGENKLDYYLSSAVVWTSAGCGPTRQVTVTVTLTNSTPAQGFPTYVTQRQDKPTARISTGDSRVLFYYIGTDGGTLSSITVAGTPGTVTPGSSGGHPTYSTLVELPRGRATTLVLTLREPASALAPVAVQQPMVHPGTVSVHTEACR